MRSRFEIEIIKCVLSKIPELIDTSTFPKYIDNLIDEIISNLAVSVKYLDIRKDEILFKYGDNNEFFYIIIDGSIDLIKPQEIVCEFSEEDYLIYLTHLKMIEEYELLQNVLKINKEVYDLDKDFENWILNPVLNEPKRSDYLNNFLDLSNELDKIPNLIKKKEMQLNERKRMSLDNYIEQTKYIKRSETDTKKKKIITYEYHLCSNLEQSNLLGEFNLKGGVKK